MKPERRNHHRVKAQNIKADVLSIHPSEPELSLSGEIIDISRTGIRIKLNEPLDKNVNDKKLSKGHILLCDHFLYIPKSILHFHSIYLRLHKLNFLHLDTL